LNVENHLPVQLEKSSAARWLQLSPGDAMVEFTQWAAMEGVAIRKYYSKTWGAIQWRPTDKPEAPWNTFIALKATKRTFNGIIVLEAIRAAANLMTKHNPSWVQEVESSALPTMTRAVTALMAVPAPLNPVQKKDMPAITLTQVKNQIERNYARNKRKAEKAKAKASEKKPKPEE